MRSTKWCWQSYHYFSQHCQSASAILTDSTFTVIAVLDVKHFIHGFISDVLAESQLQWLISYWGNWVILNGADTSCGCQCALGRGCCKSPLSIWGCRKPACRQKKLIHPAPCATLQALFNPEMSIFVQKRPSYSGDLNSETPGDSKNAILHGEDLSIHSTQLSIHWFNRSFIPFCIYTLFWCCSL